MRKIILLVVTVFSVLTAVSQDFSNKGKDFWVGYGYHERMNAGGGGGSQDMVLYFATDQVTNITIEIPALGYIQNITSAAGNNVLTSATIPKNSPDARLLTEGLSDKGIHITSDQPMVAYAHIYNASVSGATILFPKNTLGKEYYSVNFKNTSNSNNSNCWFYVVATDTGTTSIEITPTGNTTGGWIAGTTYTVNLTQGQVYNVMGVLTTSSNPYQGVDLTGSKIKSIASGSGGCKKIAVFSGSGRISITCNNGSSSSDNYMAQALPQTAWGKKYLTTQAAGNQAFNYYRVCVSDPTTVVKINGAVTGLPLINGFYYEIPATNQPQLIEADKSVTVAQYFTSQGQCGNGANPGDPEVIYLSSVEQSIEKVIWNATPNFAILAHYFNVVIKNTGTAISSFRLNGAAVPAASFTVHPQDPSYSYIRQAVGAGFNIIQSDSGFNAIAYGFGGAESYGYNAGTNVRDLTQQLELATTYGIENSPSVCTNAPFVFKVYFPDSSLSATPLPIRFDSLRWSLTNPNIIVPNNFPIVQINPTIDSTNIRNGRQVNWYSLPTTYFFNTALPDTLILTAYKSTNEGCGTSIDYEFPIQISDPPVGDFTWTPSGCVAIPYQFTEITPQLPKPTYRWYWNFGDPASGAANTSTIRNPTHLFSAPGTYTVKYVAYTTPGCVVDTITKTTIVVPDLPNATINGTTAVCVNGVPPVITFTGTDGTAGYTFTYTINGGAPQTVSSVGTATTATVTVPTLTAGTFTYNLVSVQNVATALCIRPITGQTAIVTVNPLPTANIGGTVSVCQNASSPLITFTGATGTAPYTFTYNINGGANQTITTVAGNSVTIAAPTNVVGVFSYNLVSVVDASSTLCMQAQTGTAVVTVNPLPTAAIAGTNAVCRNAASPLITFTGAAGVAPYTFTYNINGGPNQTVTTVIGNSVTIAAPTNVVGVFNYNLVSVLDASATLCTQAQTGLAVITVNDLPTASIAGSITVCLNAPAPNITFTGANTTAPYTFTYTINGGPAQTVTTVSGNSVTVPVSTAVAGTFTYTLLSVMDGSSTLCSQAQTGSAVVTVNPLPTAAIAGNTTVCRNSASPLITFTGAVGTAPYNFTYNINGGPNQTITTVAGNSVTVTVPTNVVGTFSYNLVSVQEGSANACSQAQTGSAVVTVNDLPTAGIAGTIAVCLNAPSPLVTFTGAGTVAPYTFTYTINGGPNQTITTVAGNSVTVAVPTAVAGTFTYALVNVRDASSTLCSQAQTGSAIVTVDPLPTANFNYSAPSCATRTIDFTDLSAPNVGTITDWLWNFGDPGSGAANTSILQNPSHTFAAAGAYTVSLIVTTSRGCSNIIFTRTVNIDYRPAAGFIIPEVCLSDTYAQFLDTSRIVSGSVTGWDWDFGDPNATVPNPNTSTLQNPTHSYTAVGTYNVRLIATSNNGCRDTITQLLTVNGSFPNAIFSVNNPNTLCANDSIAVVEASTVFPGVITKVEIWFDNVTAGPPGPPNIIDNSPFTGKVYRHLYPNFQAPLTRVFQIRYRAYSGGVCLDDSIRNITVNAAPLVQFNNMPNSCLLIPPFQITQASETGGVPGTGVYTGPGVSPTGIFTPGVAGIGTHTILYTFTSTAGGCVDTMSNLITVLDTAHAVFSYNSPICEQVPVSFTDNSTAPGTVVLANTVWNFGDGTPVENHPPGSTFTHTFAAPGTYTVTMYNVSAVGCNSTVTSQTVTVDANHIITLNAAGGSNNQSLCINTSITDIIYTLSGGATNATVTGLPTGVTYSVVGTQVRITGAPSPLAGGPVFNYTVTTSGNSCVLAAATGSITVQPDHTISYAAGDTVQSVCVNTAINPFTYNLGGGASGVTITGLPPGVTFAVAGNLVTISGTPNTTAGGPDFPFTLTTTGNACLTATANGSIKVNPYPVTSFAPDKPDYCIPNAIVKFNNSSTMPDGSGMTYVWNFGDGSPTNTGVSPTHWYATTGPFSVTLTATSLAVLNGGIIGCTSPHTILVDKIHPQPRADFRFSKPSICIGDRVVITDNTDGKDGIVNQWRWDMGDGNTDNRNPLTYLFGDTITYNITMHSINSFGCNSDTITKPFTVYPFPHVSAGPDKVVLEGGSVQLESVTFANDPQYLWTPDLYLTDATVARPRVVDPKTDMTYRLTVTGRGGCSLPDNVFVKLLKFPVIPNTFTPNGDGINDTWRIDYLFTYPNNRVQIFTRSGQQVFESRGYTSPWDGTLKGKPLPFDTYYYIIEPGNGRDPITGYVTIIK